MIIKTITCHDVYNYGASLQAYALQYFLAKQGHNVEIIDYIPDYLNRTYNFWYISDKSRFYNISQKNPLIHLLYSIWNIPRTYATCGRIYPFKKFKSSHLKCTHKYRTYLELKQDPPKADIYIAGSDQIWNSLLPNGKDPAFFLNFGEKTTKRISYAASFGIPSISKDIKKQTQLYLSCFNKISVRECTGAKILQELGYNSTVVVDPVFLLKSSEWKDLITTTKRIIKEDYILVYDIFQDNEQLTTATKELSAKYNLKIVSINDNKKSSYAHINISNGGPIEFLNLLYNASFVISCSFHATAFSVIFNKPFWVFYRKSNISRMMDFLKIINLEQCLNPQSFEPNEINWSKVNAQLKGHISKSIEFLLQNL